MCRHIHANNKVCILKCYTNETPLAHLTAVFNFKFKSSISMYESVC